MAQERWQISGDSADYYERYVSLLMEPWVQALVDVIEPQPGDRILDVGCGPGFVARRAAEKVSTIGQVVGLDMNESMLSKAREFTPSCTGVSIEWREGDAQWSPTSCSRWAMDKARSNAARLASKSASERPRSRPWRHNKRPSSRESGATISRARAVKEVIPRSTPPGGRDCATPTARGASPACE